MSPCDNRASFRFTKKGKTLKHFFIAKSISIAVGVGALLVLLTSCGGGTPLDTPTSSTSTGISVNTVTSDHGMGNLEDIKLAAIGTDVYALVTKLSASNYVLSLYKSTDSGKTWIDLKNTPSSLPSLTGYSLTATGSVLLLSGGRTSDATITDSTKYTYNGALYRFTPSTSAGSGSWAVLQGGANIYAATPLTGSPKYALGREDPAAIYDASTGVFYLHGGDSQGAIAYDVYSSTNAGDTTSAKATSYVINSSDIGFVREKHCMLAMNGWLYAFGGYGVTAYDRSANTATLGDIQGMDQWNPTSTSPVAAVSGTSILVPSPIYSGCAASGTKMVLLGGTDTATLKGSANNVSSQLTVVNRSSDGQLTIGFLGTLGNVFARYKHGMTPLSTGKVIVVGGIGQNQKKLTDVMLITF